MNLNSLRKIGIGISMAAAALGCISCVDINTTLGGKLVPVSQQYDIRYAEFPLKDIQLKLTDSLSGASSTRITVGTIKDKDL